MKRGDREGRGGRASERLKLELAGLRGCIIEEAGRHRENCRRLTSAEEGLLRANGTDGGRQCASGSSEGSAALRLGLVHGSSGWEVSLGLPFALHLSGAAGKAWPDLRMQLIQLQLSRGPRRASSSVQHGAGGSWGLLHRDAEGPDSPSLVGPTACLMLAFIMFPDQVGPLINRLWPAGALALAGPRAARQGLKWAKAARQGSRRRHPGPPAADPTEGQPDSTSDHPESWAQARAFGRMLQPLGQAVRVLAGPAALLRGGALLLEALAPPGVISTSQALLGLLAVMFQYNRLARDIRCGRIEPGAPAEAAWRAAHKRSAQRLAPYLGDLPDKPPLGFAADAISAASLHIGLPVAGMPPLGALSSSSLPGGGGGAAGGGAAGATPWGSLTLSIPWPLAKHATSDEQGQAAADRAQAMQATQPAPPHATTHAGAAATPVAASATGGAVATPAAGELTPGTVGHTSPGLQLHTPAPTPGSSAPASVVDGTVYLTAHAHTGLGSGAAALPAAPAPQRPSVASCSGAMAQTAPPSLAAAAAAALADGKGAAGASVRSMGYSDDEESPADPAAQASTTWASHPGQHAAPAPAAAQPHGQSSQAAASSAPVVAQPPQPPASAMHAAAVAVPAQAPVPQPPLPLYGRADHCAVEPVLGLYQYLTLALRGGSLFMLFAPFLFIGCALLLFASWQGSRSGKRSGASAGRAAPGQGSSSGRHGGQQQHQQQLRQPQQQQAPAEPSLEQLAREAEAAMRERLHSHPQASSSPSLAAARHLHPDFLAGVGGSMVSAPSASRALGAELPPAAALARATAWRLLLAACRSSGAAFIKWGQWAATRGDLFPPDFCDILSNLHDKAPAHSFEHTRREVEAAFGAPLEQLFLSFDPKPLASGSIAQVHRAVLRDPRAVPGDGSVQEVVVKVRHPGVAEAIHRDFQVVKPLAALASRFRALKGLSLKETLSQFSHTMTAQADLRVEAAHILRFATAFAPVSKQVAIPRLVPGMVSQAVLVESYEPGRSVAHFTKRRTPINTELVGLGVDTYLAMLLKHNFVHTDLHPGNIMVRMLDAQGRLVDSASSGLDAMLSAGSSGSGSGRGPSYSGGAATQHGLQPGGSSACGGDRGTGKGRGKGHAGSHQLRAQLVLLDFGLAEELTPRVRKHFISFLNCIAAGNGRRAAWHLLRWAERQQDCPDPLAFTRAIEELFAEHCDIHSPQGIDLDLVMKSVLRLACRHEVTIDSAYASLAIAVCVLVGFATSLDPEVNLMDAAAPCLLAHSLTGRVVGRLYS